MRRLRRVSGQVYNHELGAFFGEGPCDHSAYAPGTGHDRVVPHVCDALIHTASLQETQNVSLEQELNELRECEAQSGHTRQDHEHRECLAHAAERLDLPVADRPHGDDRHVQGVKQTPTFEQHVADDPDNEHCHEYREGQDEAVSHRNTASSLRATIARRLRW